MPRCTNTSHLMTTQKINHTYTPSFLNHGIFVNVLLLFYTLSFAGAQPETPPPSDQLSISHKFNPSMAIIMVVLVSAFFFLGFFSVYVRQCAERRFQGASYNPAAAAGIGGGGRRLWRRPGLDPAVIETFPTFIYSTVKGLKIGKGSLECAVCLNEFEDDQSLRLIPKCSHVFHPDCIDAWLNSHTTCPVCRANLVPKPDDLTSVVVDMFEPDNNPVEPDPDANVNHQTQNQHVVHVPDDDDQIREVPQMQSPDVNLLIPTDQNRPPRSRSTGWGFNKLLPRSHSTGHSLLQSGENCERFTLRLPEEIRSQLMNTHLNRTKSCGPFYRVRSPRRGYRSRSAGTGRSRNNSYYERFDREGQPDRWGFTMTPPFIARTGSVQTSQRGSDEVNATPPKNFLWPVKPSFDRLFRSINSNNNIGERSSDRLRHDNQV